MYTRCSRDFQKCAAGTSGNIYPWNKLSRAGRGAT
jgi:hypothetical protein